MTSDRKPDGVVREDGIWVAYVNGNEVAAGPDRLIVVAAFEFHRSADEFRSSPDDSALGEQE